MLSSARRPLIAESIVNSKGNREYHKGSSQGDRSRGKSIERDAGQRARHHAVNQSYHARYAEERPPRRRDNAHVRERPLEVVVTTKKEVAAVLARELEVVVTDSVDRLCADRVVDARLENPYERRRAEEDECGQDHECTEADIECALALRDQCKRNEARGEAAEVDRRAAETLGDRRRAGALQGEVLCRQSGEQSTSIWRARLHGQTA